MTSDSQNLPSSRCSHLSDSCSKLEYSFQNFNSNILNNGFDLHEESQHSQNERNDNQLSETNSHKLVESMSKFTESCPPLRIDRSPDISQNKCKPTKIKILKKKSTKMKKVLK